MGKLQKLYKDQIYELSAQKEKSSMGIENISIRITEENFSSLEKRITFWSQRYTEN